MTIINYYNKITICFLTIVICFDLCAYGKSSAAKEVEQLIDGIGEITLQSEECIINAEKHYITLTEGQRDEVDNYYDLVQARTAYDKLVYDSQTFKEINEALCITYIVLF